MLCILSVANSGLVNAVKWSPGTRVNRAFGRISASTSAEDWPWSRSPAATRTGVVIRDSAARGRNVRAEDVQECLRVTAEPGDPGRLPGFR